MILIAGILVMSAIAGFLIWKNRPAAHQVVVTLNGNVCGTFDLDKDQTILIEPDDGRWHNTLQIKDGKADMIEADCDNQICVMTPALGKDMPGMIVCLPHGLAVELQ